MADVLIVLAFTNKDVVVCEEITALLMPPLKRPTAALTVYALALPVGGLNLPAGYRIYAGTTVAAGGTNIAIAVNAIGGDY